MGLPGRSIDLGTIFTLKVMQRWSLWRKHRDGSTQESCAACLVVGQGPSSLAGNWVMLVSDVHVPAWCRAGLHAPALQQGRGQASPRIVTSVRGRQAHSSRVSAWTGAALQQGPHCCPRRCTCHACCCCSRAAPQGTGPLAGKMPRRKQVQPGIGTSQVCRVQLMDCYRVTQEAPLLCR